MKTCASCAAGSTEGSCATCRRIPLAQGGRTPRSLLIAWYYVALTNSEISPESLTGFLNGFQTEMTLDIAELWAVPTFVRYVLIENLRRLSDRVGPVAHAARQRQRSLPTIWLR